MEKPKSDLLEGEVLIKKLDHNNHKKLSVILTDKRIILGFKGSVKSINLSELKTFKMVKKFNGIIAFIVGFGVFVILCFIIAVINVGSKDGNPGDVLLAAGFGLTLFLVLFSRRYLIIETSSSRMTFNAVNLPRKKELENLVTIVNIQRAAVNPSHL